MLLFSVTSTGLAQCASGAVGTYSVWANDPMPLGPGIYNCPASTACGGGYTIQATARSKTDQNKMYSAPADHP